MRPFQTRRIRRISIRPFLGLILLSWAAPGYGAAEGAEIAERHPVILDRSSETVLGNGRIGCHIQSASESSSFLQARFLGEQWLRSEPGEKGKSAPAARVPLADLALHLALSNDPSVESLRLTDGAVLSRANQKLAKSARLGSKTLSASVILAPTENMVLVSVESDGTFDAKISITIPNGGVSAHRFEQGLPDKPSDGALLAAMGQTLPLGESFGVGLMASGGAIRVATSSRGWDLECSSTANLHLRIVFTGEEEGETLLQSASRRIEVVAATEEARLLENITAWWSLFWDRSILDLSGSTDPAAKELERCWIDANHALAVHARGTFPPTEGGFWNLEGGGRAWHPTLWMLYSGWIFSNHAADIGCLLYPLDFDSMEADSRSHPLEPLLPLESGPDGVPTDAFVIPAKAGIHDEAADRIARRLEEAVGVSSADLTGPLFSAVPLLAAYYETGGGPWETVAGLYPFLKANADLAARILCDSWEEPARPARVRHLLIAIETARRIAERIRVDRPAREKWEGCLDDIPSFQALKDHPFPIGELLTSGRNGDASSRAEEWIGWVGRQPRASDGVFLATDGTPSLIKTGWVLRKLVDLFFSEEGGVLRILPGVPMDGSWSVRVERLSTPSGFALLSLSMRKGVVDSFLLRSGFGGICRLELPPGWSSGRVAHVGDLHEPVELDREEEISRGDATRKVIDFQTEGGEEYLIGPVW